MAAIGLIGIAIAALVTICVAVIVAVIVVVCVIVPLCRGNENMAGD